MHRFNEASLEQVVIERLEENGFTYVYGDDIERETTDVLIREDLISYLKKQYPELTDAERARFIKTPPVKARYTIQTATLCA